LQIANISDDNRVTFKSTGLSRSTVLNRDISTAIPTTVEQDDYICVVRGVCVPYLKKPLSNFIIQYAIAELKQKLNEPADMALRVLKELEEQVKHQWVGREQSLRIKKRSKHWPWPLRRYYTTNSQS
jgi:hypothetical protein